MKSLDCPLKHIWQRGRTFKAHTQAIRNNNNNSGYSNQILNIGNISLTHSWS
jgi:hypothetical protein